MPYGLTYMWNLNTKQTKTVLIDPENRLRVARAGKGRMGGEMGVKRYKFPVIK